MGKGYNPTGDPRGETDCRVNPLGVNPLETVGTLNSMNIKNQIPIGVIGGAARQKESTIGS